MIAYDYLSPPLQGLVDRMADLASGSDWEICRAYLASVYAALERHSGPLDPEADLATIIAALLERLGEPPITDGLQASIYAASAKAEHRAASIDWFDDHPDQFLVMQHRLARGVVLN
jgi:hypothetical protein